MTQRIASTELRLGMYIHKLGGSWLKHPFLRSSFLLTDPEDIKSILQAGIKDVWIDEEKGESFQKSDYLTPSSQHTTEESSDTLEVTQKTTEKPSVVETSMEEDISRARRLFNDAKPQVLAMYKDARLGKAIDPQTTLPLVNEIDLMVQQNSAAILSVARLKTHHD